MLQTSTVAPDTLELLIKLQSIPELTETRLVGGTALTFHLGHRLSVDLDLFGNFEQSILTETLRAEDFNQFNVFFENKVIKHYQINQVKVDIVKYDKYPWLDALIEEKQIRVAGLKDIAAMKIAAITNRGSKKDFIDLFFLLKLFHLKEIINFYMTKYTDTTAFLAFRSLVYFEDAEKDEMPKMLIPVMWEDVKDKISLEVKKM
jgi:predicted nucleotidyltransferase component of viral defense system